MEQHGQLNAELTAITTGRNGAFTSAEAKAAGYTKSMIAGRVRSGQWLPVRKGVYAERTVAEVLHTRQFGEHLLGAEAAMLARPGSAISHASAVRWHNLACLRRIGAGRPVELTQPTQRRARQRVGSGLHVHNARLPGDHLLEVAGVRVTTVTRTVADIARDASFVDAVVVGDSALATGRTTRAELTAALNDMRHWPGVSRAREVIDCLDARAPNPLESLAHAVWSDSERARRRSR